MLRRFCSLSAPCSVTQILMILWCLRLPDFSKLTATSRFFMSSYIFCFLLTFFPPRYTQLAKEWCKKYAM